MITEEKTFKGIISDRIFKVFFKCPYVLEDFLNSYFSFFNINQKVKFSNINYQALMTAPNIKKKDFYSDCIATLDNEELIIVEAYTSFHTREFKKSTNYLSRLYTSQMNFKDNNYLKCKKCTCINLITNNYRNNNYLINRIIPKYDITNQIINDGETEMVLIRVDLVENIEYINSNERFIKWLKIINAKGFKEMKELAGGNKIMDSSIEYLKWYHENLDNGFEDILEEIIYEAQQNARKEAKKEARKEAKNTKLDIAKNMLKDNLSIEAIKKFTGLSEKQIKRLMAHESN